MSILLYGYTTWTLTKCIEKRLDGNCNRILRTILIKSWKQHPAKQKLYGHLPPIFKTIQIRTRHAGHCWRSKDNSKSTFSYGPLHTDVQVLADQQELEQLCADAGYSQEDLLNAMDVRDEWRERLREIRASSTT